MRALITGGAGFIGSHLAGKLLSSGWEVSVVDDLSTGSITNIQHLKREPRFQYVIDSVMNRRLLAELVDDSDVIFHLAAAVGVRLIVESPIRTLHTNVHATELVLEAASKKKKEGLDHLYLRGIRKIGRYPVPGGWRPGHRLPQLRTLELRLFEGPR